MLPSITFSAFHMIISIQWLHSWFVSSSCCAVILNDLAALQGYIVVLTGIHCIQNPNVHGMIQMQRLQSLFISYLHGPSFISVNHEQVRWVIKSGTYGLIFEGNAAIHTSQYTDANCRIIKQSFLDKHKCTNLPSGCPNETGSITSDAPKWPGICFNVILLQTPL